MSLFRLLLIGAVIWIAWRMLQGVRINVTRIEPPARKPEEFEAMARCSQCGVHLPASALSPQGLCGKCASPR